MKSILRPLLLLSAVTFILTSILWYITHYPIWILIALSITIQYLANYVYQELLLIYVGMEGKKLEVEMARELSYQTATIECPCSLKVNQSVNLRLNEDTTYKCFQCNKPLKATVQVMSTLSTTPVPTDGESFDELLQKAQKLAEKK